MIATRSGFAYALLSGLLITQTPVFANDSVGQWSGLLKTQTGYSLEPEQIQQQEWLLDVEYNRPVGQGELTAIARMRLDLVDDLNQADSDVPDTYSSIGKPLLSGPEGQLDLRELYWQTDLGQSFWRLGKQQVVWGEADGIKLLDVINPQSFREFTLDEFDDSRIPLWMVNAEFTLANDGLLQLLWIPDTTVHELPPQGSPFAFTSPSLVPPTPDQPVELNQPQAPSGFDSADFGLRYSQFLGGWDFSLNYLYHYVDTPVVRARVEQGNIIVDQDYERSHLIGGAASTVIGDWTLRMEAIYETDRYHRASSALPGVTQSDQWSSLLGVDWQGWTDQFISLQWAQTTLQDPASDSINQRREDTFTLLWQSNFLNETLTSEFLVLHSPEYDDGVVQWELSYNYQTGIDLILAADIFYGDQRGLFGQFRNADRITAALHWGF